jgi:hypothetical protein
MRTSRWRVTIYSRDHFLLSAAVGIVASLYAGVDPLTGVGWVAFAAVVGVAVDFDHCLVAALWVLTPALATLAAVTLYVHVVADLVADSRELRATNESLR